MCLKSELFRVARSSESKAIPTKTNLEDHLYLLPRVQKRRDIIVARQTLTGVYTRRFAALISPMRARFHAIKCSGVLASHTKFEHLETRSECDKIRIDYCDGSGTQYNSEAEGAHELDDRPASWPARNECDDARPANSVVRAVSNDEP